MGAEAMGVVQIDLKLTDPKVCRSFICGTCPHDLFTNTKMDLGACPHTHSTRLKDEFDLVYKVVSGQVDGDDSPYTSTEVDGLRAEYERNIHSFVEDCDRRIRAAQRRLEKTPEENNKTTALMREIGEIQTAYEAAMTEVEALGESGKVEESMMELAKAEALKAEKLDKEKELQILSETSGASGHQKLRVCDICGAYLSILDSDRRLADHFGGKMHLGYLQLRQTLEEWKNRPASAVPRLAPLPNSMPPPSAPYAGANGPPIRDERKRDDGYPSRDDRDRRRHHDDRDGRGDRDRYGSSRRDDRDRDHGYSSRTSSRRDYDDGRDSKRSRYD